MIPRPRPISGCCSQYSGQWQLGQQMVTDQKFIPRNSNSSDAVMYPTRFATGPGRKLSGRPTTFLVGGRLSFALHQRSFMKSSVECEILCNVTLIQFGSRLPKRNKKKSMGSKSFLKSLNLNSLNLISSSSIKKAWASFCRPFFHVWSQCRSKSLLLSSSNWLWTIFVSTFFCILSFTCLFFNSRSGHTFGYLCGEEPPSRLSSFGVFTLLHFGSTFCRDLAELWACPINYFLPTERIVALLFRRVLDVHIAKVFQA